MWLLTTCLIVLWGCSSNSQKNKIKNDLIHVINESKDMLVKLNEMNTDTIEQLVRRATSLLRALYDKGIDKMPDTTKEEIMKLRLCKDTLQVHLDILVRLKGIVEFSHNQCSNLLHDIEKGSIPDTLAIKYFHEEMERWNRTYNYCTSYLESNERCFNTLNNKIDEIALKYGISGI